MNLNRIITVVVLAIALVVTGCSEQSNKNTIKIATKPMTEQFILSEMLAILIKQHSSLDVEITKGIGGGTANIHPALLNGEFDLYPEYTGTAWNFVLKQNTLPDDATLFTQLSQQYHDQFQLEWVGLYGFNNTFGLVVNQDIANKYQLNSYSDLVPYSNQLVFGAEYDFFERNDGYQTLVDTYQFNFNKQIDLDIGLKYPAINDQQIDVMNVFTTDGQLSSAHVHLLYDDKHFYQSYYCGTVIRQDVLKKHPELRQVLMMMNNLITEQAMSKMNYQVEVEGMDEYDVALAFLLSKGLAHNE